MIQVTYGKGFAPDVPMTQKVWNLQKIISDMPQYEPETAHYFHGGMYCRKVARCAGALVVGKVHKKEHFYLILEGTVMVTTDDGVQEITGPQLLLSKPGTKRAVYAVTDATCMTFHATRAVTVDAAEEELVEEDPAAMLGVGNRIKQQEIEVTS